MEMTPGQAGRGGTPRLQASQPSRAGSRPSGTASGAVPVVTAMPDAAGPRPVTIRPQDAPRHAGLPPSADEALDVTASRRQDVSPAATQARPPRDRTAFTWRLTADQALTLDEMMLRLKRELGRAKLDRAEMLAALVGLAADNPGVFGALVARLQADQAS
jgi:hypothetical protein